ncbi:aspartic peptidase domain-containing protein [Massariosphaeria phaeospora]|uniref:Aspartic peptidase domain-containing protein n=1 Tax=Massariosphaeria phaeospora TaxID=100035 RepID=A0A7C8I403_9PLEO|nr:aspartic peptidase domain-containing protein [Massariosphaeria phaeospora]
MYMLTVVAFLSAFVSALERKAAAPIAVTPHVLKLVAAPHGHPVAPSTKHLARRRESKTRRQDDAPTEDTSPSSNLPLPLHQALLTLGGRIYMTTVTLGSRPYTLVIDTGSSDTWIASSAFQCISPLTRDLLPQSSCGFGDLYMPEVSDTYTNISTHSFNVNYADGEFLSGEMGWEELGIGTGVGGAVLGGGDAVRGDSGGGLRVNQTIGVVTTGYWMGDRTSSGLMGLAYSTLASNFRSMNYTSIIFTLFKDPSLPALFSLALSRPTPASPIAGGLLAIGGIPDVPHDNDFAIVPINPIFDDIYAFYAIPVDGFDISMPNKTAAGPRTKRDGEEGWDTPEGGDGVADLDEDEEAEVDMDESEDEVQEERNQELSQEQDQTQDQPQNETAPLTTQNDTDTDPLPQSFSQYKNYPVSMIVDSGATLNYFPDAVASAIANAFSPPATYSVALNIYTVPCTALAPRVGVIIAGKTFFIHEADLMDRAVVVELGPKKDIGGGLTQRERRCMVAMQMQREADAVLGDAWLKGVLAVFDLGRDEMRFAGREEH